MDLSQKIFHSRTDRSAQRGVWDLESSESSIQDEGYGEARARVSPATAGVYSRTIVTRRRREEGTEEWNDRVMPDCRLLFQLDKPDPSSDRIHPLFSPILPNPAYRPSPRSNRLGGGLSRGWWMQPENNFRNLPRSFSVAIGKSLFPDNEILINFHLNNWWPRNYSNINSLKAVYYFSR